ncbi:glycosyl hydrolase family 61-domain-containing protein [Aspergillus bertholletiae]|uniref:Glycosyl hydrolase family 61-domain-containing protein n=1 Tax=Aspergillus bertholletiae TaxID=1226010 RepID=A0A5N7BA34_9EURO|nr:glycosyl hydrolase family 61-domain-containing protein [Aspergillus bertholletiae]
MSIAKIAGVVLGSAALVAGHGYVSGAVVDGQYYSGYDMSYHYMSDPPKVIGWSTDATDLGFVDGSEYAEAEIICHKNAKNGAISAEIAAGKQVELQWTDWPESHKGPVITYLANCNGDCSTVDKTKLEFFKIDEKGLISGSSNTWASDNLISSNNSWTVTIPSSIAAGNYVMRHEIIALHSAGNKDGAQNYPQCLNFKVTGGGSEKPEGTLGTALYKDTDPGILINIYQTLSSYTIPGPALFGGSSSGSSGSSSAAPSATASASASTTAAPVQTSTATAYQTSTAVASVTVTGSSPAQTHVQATGSSAAASTPTASSGSSSGASSSDLTEYFNSLSADELLNVIKQTISWLVTDKIHARDISA